MPAYVKTNRAQHSGAQLCRTLTRPAQPIRAQPKRTRASTTARPVEPSPEEPDPADLGPTMPNSARAVPCFRPWTIHITSAYEDGGLLDTTSLLNTSIYVYICFHIIHTYYFIHISSLWHIQGLYSSTLLLRLSFYWKPGVEQT